MFHKLGIFFDGIAKVFVVDLDEHLAVNSHLPFTFHIVKKNKRKIANLQMIDMYLKLIE